MVHYSNLVIILFAFPIYKWHLGINSQEITE